MEKGTKSKRPTESRWGASYSLQLRILFIRAIKTRRFDSMSSQDLFQFIVVGVLTGEPATPQSPTGRSEGTAAVQPPGGSAVTHVQGAADVRQVMQLCSPHMKHL